MIHIEHLYFTYPKADVPTLKDLNFGIDKGEIFGFLGPSGAGKSTTQKILYKLLGGYTGTARIKSKSLTDWNTDLYDQIGVCFELPNHYLKLTAMENLEFFGSFYKKIKYDPLELLDWVGLKKDANKRVGEFSKGMKMRLNFIRALLHDPEILFLDEPTAGLDPVNGLLIKQIILDLRDKGKTIFITTHNMHDADMLCDRVAFIVDGEIKVIDSPKNLKQIYSKHTVEVLLQNEVEPKTFPLKELGNNADFLNLIQQNDVETIHSKEATLDEIFIEVTGKTLI